MKKQLITVMLALVALSTAQAKIGQTPQEVIQDARREKAVDVQWVEYLGKQLLQVTYHDDIVCHLFGADGREIAFYYVATKGLKPEDVEKLKRRYRTTWRGTGTDGRLFSWESTNGLSMVAERCQGYDLLIIFDTSRIQEIPEIRNAMPAPSLASTPAPDVYPPPQQPYVAPIAPVLTPQAMPTPMTPSNPQVVAGRTPNDCYVIASQIYARLKTSSYWVKVAGLMIKEKSINEVGGHAVVFSQLTPSSNVVMSDENGGLDLQMKSHDLQEITDAAAQISSKSPKVPYIVQSAKWIDEASPPVVATPHKSSTSSATADDTAYQVGYLLGYFATIAILFTGYISLIVICFLKGKGGMAVLGIFGFFVPFLWWATLIGAIRIAKPFSWWARKKYGPEKMDIAHRRFTPVYNEVQKATPVIIDDPVERALERVRTNQLITT